VHAASRMCSSFGLDGPGHNVLRGKNQIAGRTSGNAKLIGGKDPPTGRVPLSGSPDPTIGAMHSLGEMSQTGVHRHPAAVSRRPVSLLPAPTDFARPIFALCSSVRRNSNGVVPLRPAAIRTGQMLAARFRFAFLVPVGDRVAGNLVELHAEPGRAIGAITAGNGSRSEHDCRRSRGCARSGHSGKE
jgi:hypothetical protein